MTTTGTDNGLGIAEFLHPTAAAAEPEGEKPSPAETIDTSVSEAEAADEKPAEAAVEKPGEEPKPDEGKPAEKPIEAKPDPWESPDNPWKTKAEQAELRLKETRDWTTRTNQELADLKRAIEIQGKKQDGTYDPEIDDKPPEIRPEQFELQGRVQASTVAARQLFGDDAVNGVLDPNGEYAKLEGSNPAIRARVLAAPAPVMEALKVMKELSFGAKYGTDPDKIVANVIKEHEAKIEAEVTKRLTKQFEGRLTKRDNQPAGVADARGSGDQAAHGHNGVRPLSSFGNPGLASR